MLTTKGDCRIKRYLSDRKYMSNQKEEYMTNVDAVVPATGEGRRLGLGPKALLKIDGQTMLEHVVKTLEGVVGKIVVGVPAEHAEQIGSTLKGRVDIAEGGSTRQATIGKLIEKTTSDIILIHDGNRPFADKRMFIDVAEAAIKHGAASAFINNNNTIGCSKGSYIVESVPREVTRLSQTPQAYKRSLLIEAYKKAGEDGFEAHSTWELILRLGKQVKVVQGNERNLKITTSFDWEIARELMKGR